MTNTLISNVYVRSSSSIGEHSPCWISAGESCSRSTTPMFVPLFSYSQVSVFLQLLNTLRTTHNYRIAHGSDGVEDERNEDHVVVWFEFFVFESSEDGSQDDDAICDSGQQVGTVHDRVVVHSSRIGWN